MTKMIVPILALDRTRTIEKYDLCKNCIFYKDEYLCDLEFIFNENDFFCSDYNEQNEEYTQGHFILGEYDVDA